MSVDERHFHADQLLGDGVRLLGIAGVVFNDHLELLAEHAAGGVDVGDGEFGAVLELLPERGVLAGQGPGDADGDVRSRCRAGKSAGKGRLPNP